MEPERSRDSGGQLVIDQIDAFQRAAKEHLSPRLGSVRHLAIGARAWRQLQASNPGWRKRNTDHELTQLDPTSPAQVLAILTSRVAAKSINESITEILSFKEQQTLALEYEEQFTKAFLEKDHAFTQQLTRAFRLSDDEIDTPAKTLPGSVLEVYDRLYIDKLLDATPPTVAPTKHKIQALIDQQRKESHLPPLTERHWERTWKEPFIAALMRCR